MTKAEETLHALIERLSNQELGREIVTAAVALVDERLERAGIKLPRELPPADEITVEHCRDLVALAGGAGAHDRVVDELARHGVSLAPAQLAVDDRGRQAALTLAHQVAQAAPTSHLPRAAWTAFANGASA
jgi:hypothetical protein